MKRWVTTTLLIGAVGIWGQAPATTARTGVETKLVIENPIAPLGGAIFAQRVVKNLGKAGNMAAPLDSKGVVRVVTADGVEIAPSAYYQGQFHRVWRSVAGMGLGEILTNAIEVTKLFDLTKPGKYTLIVGSDAAGGANRATFEITPSASNLDGPETAFRTLAKTFPEDFRSSTVEFDPKQVAVTQEEPVTLDLDTIRIKAIEPSSDIPSERRVRVSVLLPSGERKEVFDPLPIRFPSSRIDSGRFTTRVILSRWVRFDQVGQYKVAYYVQDAEEPAVVTVNVGPRDDQKLEKLAKSLARSGGGVDALVTMRNDIAVRALSEAPSTYFESIYGLEVLAAYADREDAARAIRALVDHPGQEPRGRVPTVLEQAQEALDHLRKNARTEAVRKIADGGPTQEGPK